MACAEGTFVFSLVTKKCENEVKKKKKRIK